MQIVLVKSPKALRGLLRLIYIIFCIGRFVDSASAEFVFIHIFAECLISNVLYKHCVN